MVTEDYAYNGDGSLRSDQRAGGDQKSVSYSYDVNANRTGDERGTHSFNALDQEVHWTRGGPDTQNPGSTVDYVLDGTGGMLQQKSHTVQSSTQSGMPVTATSDSTTDLCSAATATAAQSNIGACQHDSDRVKSASTSSTVTASGGGQSVTKATSATEHYCYDQFADNTRITKSDCPADPAQTSGSIPGEDPKTSTIYGFDAFGRMSSAKAPDPASDASNPSIDTSSYSYDALDRRYQKVEDRGQGPATLTYSYLNDSVRHEALSNRVGCKAPPPGCRSSPVKLRAA